jgi:hypothetical protein
VTGPMSTEAVIASSLKGIVAAQKAYESWSDEWLWNAPEYFSTVFVAKEIARNGASKYITLENSAKSAIKDAGARGRGRLHSAIRANGRFDILLWWSNGKPRAPIEVKCQVTKADKIISDIRRIAKVIHRNKDESSIAFGAVIFYISFRDDATFTAKERITKSLKNILDEVRDEVGFSCQITLQKSRIYVEGDSAWAGAAVVLRPRNV